VGAAFKGTSGTAKLPHEIEGPTSIPTTQSGFNGKSFVSRFIRRRNKEKAWDGP